MNLFILEDAVELGGVQHSTLNFCIGLKAYPDVAVTVISPGKGDLTKALEAIGVTYLIIDKPKFQSSSISFLSDRFRLPNLIGMIKNLWAMRQYRNKLKAILPNKDYLLITKGMFAHFAAAKVTKQLIWHLQDDISNRYLGLYRLIFMHWAKHYPKAIIADGATILKAAPNSISSKAFVVYNGIDCNPPTLPDKAEIRINLGLPSDCYCIGHIARITPWKGQQYLLQAFEAYSKTNSNAHLVLIGSALFADNSYLSSLKEFCNSKGIEDKVHFLGYRNDLMYCLKAIDTFIYPSIEKDTSPLSLITAMVAAKPIAFSDIEGLKEMMQGLSPLNVFKNKSISAIQSAIELFEDEVIRLEQGNANRQFAIEHFSIESYTKNILEIAGKYYA